MIIGVRNFRRNNDLDFFNIILSKASFDRYELREAKNGVLYLYDFDEPGVVRDRFEMMDIIENQYLMDFTTEYETIKRVLRRI